jgi:hypothetical protein
MNKQTNFEAAMEEIGQALYELNEDKTSPETITLLNTIGDSYVLVQWPESQELMEEDWFDEEAIFCGGSEDKTGSSAYFVPIKRLI